MCTIPALYRTTLYCLQALLAQLQLKQIQKPEQDTNQGTYLLSLSTLKADIKYVVTRSMRH